jgi:hypothetical protein
MEDYHQYKPELCRRFDARLDDLLSKSGEGAPYLIEQDADFSDWAYFVVQAQTLLIDFDILGFQIDEPAYDASIAAGLAWYCLKLVDNYMDDHIADRGESGIFLSRPSAPGEERRIPIIK